MSQFEELALTQAELMEVLYQWVGARSDVGRSKVRSRFKSLLKVDLPSGNRPQHGKRERYSFLQCCEVVICFELAQYGIDAWDISGGEKESYDSIRNDVQIWASYLADVVEGSLLGQETRADRYLWFGLRLVGAAANNDIAAIQVIRGNLLQKEEVLDILNESMRSCIINFDLLGYLFRACLPRRPMEQFLEKIKNSSSPS